MTSFGSKSRPNGTNAMHGHNAAFLQGVSGFIGCYYLALAMVNATAALFLWQSGRARSYFTVSGLTFTTAHIWLVVVLAFTTLGGIALGGGASVLGLPSFLRSGFDQIMNPMVYTTGVLAILSLLFLGRNFFVKPMVAWTGLNLSMLFMGLSLTDYNFAQIVTKPDNVPIVAMVYLLGFFTWLAGYRAVQNDKRIASGEAPLESLDDEKVLVWPDLVYTELICMIVLTVVLIVWAVALQAPLEEPASSVKTRTDNPSVGHSR